MRDPQVTAVELALKDLLPSTRVEQSFTSSPASRKGVGRRAADSPGMMVRPDRVELWFPLPDERICAFLLTRREPFTPTERSLIRQFPAAVKPLIGVAGGTRGGEKVARRELSRDVLADVLVARFLRGNRSSGSHYAPSMILRLLQRLSFQRYEGQECSSGFVYTSKARELSGGLGEGVYRFEPFASGIVLFDGFFEEPASHRYVDGRTSMYVFDHNLMVLGVLRCARPDRFTWAARAMNEHLTPIFHDVGPNCWVAYVGSNSEVCAVTSNLAVARWAKGTWTLVDPVVARRILAAEGIEASFAQKLLATLFAMSDQRLGTVILIPEDPASRPATAGSIDKSPLAGALIEGFRSRMLEDLVASNLAIGLLSSDGLTTISRNGEILGCGEIISISGDGGLAGGGRTQAALRASKYGLAIKVSEDGPISFYKRGELLFGIS